MQIHCEKCHRLIPAADVNLERLLAKCSGCDSVFTISTAGSPLDESVVPAGTAAVPLPPGFEVLEGERDLRIRRRWLHPVAYFLIFFCAIWNGFFVLWYALALGDGWHGGLEWVALAMPIGHVAVGIGLTYYTLALLINRTTIAVAQGVLSVMHGPLPWRGTGEIPVRDIAQIYCKQKVHRHDDSTRSVYEVHAVLRAQEAARRSVKLLGGLHEADHALFIEQALEEHLGIDDEPVGGELRR